MVNDAVKEVRAVKAALANATGHGKPVRVSAIDADTAQCVAVRQLEQDNNLRWCSEGQ